MSSPVRKKNADGTRLPGDQQVLMAIDPVADDESGEDGVIGAARCAPVDVFDACDLT